MIRRSAILQSSMHNGMSLVEMASKKTKKPVEVEPGMRAEWRRWLLARSYFLAALQMAVTTSTCLLLLRTSLGTELFHQRPIVLVAAVSQGAMLILVHVVAFISCMSTVLTVLFLVMVPPASGVVVALATVWLGDDLLVWAGIGVTVSFAVLGLLCTCGRAGSSAWWSLLVVPLLLISSSGGWYWNRYGPSLQHPGAEWLTHPPVDGLDILLATFLVTVCVFAVSAHLHAKCREIVSRDTSPTWGDVAYLGLRVFVLSVDLVVLLWTVTSRRIGWAIPRTTKATSTTQASSLGGLSFSTNV
jgi:hypothetical protein